MSGNFDWSEVEDDIVVPEQAAIAVFTNPKGDIVIRQAGQYGVDEDHWIIVAPEHVAALARALLAMVEPETTARPLALPAPAATPLTNAERQRRHRNAKRNARNDDALRDAVTGATLAPAD